MTIQQPRSTTLYYVLATLGQIAGTLRGFGFSDEAEAIEKTRKDLEGKIPRIGKDG